MKAILLILTIFISMSFALNDKTKNELTHFSNSIKYHNLAVSIIQPSNKNEILYDIDEKTHEKSMKLLKLSYRESLLVSKKTLKKINRKMPYYYDKKFKKGLLLYIESLEKIDVKKGMRGSLLTAEFGEWYSRVVKKK